MARFLLCAVIVALCGYIGRLKAGGLQKRLYCLSEMNEILRCMEADMRNERLALTAALKKEAHGRKALGNLLASCARTLAAQPSKPFGEVWEEAADRETRDNAYISCLGREEASLLRKTGESLVSASMRTQDASFAMLFEAYGRAVAQARTLSEGKARLYRNLGLFAGLFAAVLLI